MNHKEIYLPQLVDDVRKIFWEHINPHALPEFQESPLRILKADSNNEHHREIFNITKKYPFLVGHLLIFKIQQGYASGIHKDGMVDDVERHRSCNIPILGCNNKCITEFYKVNDDDLIYDRVRKARFIKDGSPFEKIDEYTLEENPVLCYTQQAHRVNNLNGIETRLSVSWTVSKRWTFDSIIESIQSGKYF